MPAEAWRGALLRHMVRVALATLLVAVLVVWQGHRSATEQAGRAAAANVEAMATGIALPLSSEDLSLPAEEWSARLGEAVAPRIDRGEILTVHLWRAVDRERGEIVWSSEGQRSGEVVALGGAGEALRTGEPIVHRLDDGRDSEGPAARHVYEAYQPFADRTGTDYVLEVYKPVRQYDDIRSALLRTWLPIVLGGMLLVGLLTLPLSLRMARAVAMAERERALFAERALRARSDEHQRITERLHERTIADLAAARLLVDSIRDPAAPHQAVLDQVSGILDTDVRDLRALVVDTDAEWQADDLRSGLRDWLEGVPGGEVVDLRVDAEAAALDPGHPATSTALRVVKESVRNALKHAHAGRIEVRLSGSDDELAVEVHDDGTGFDPHAARRPEQVGLRIMRYAAASTGSRIEIDASPGQGTRIMLRVPLTGSH